mmetsp:Transcript_16301/g.23221  ORF Transcript_16301/g.23221 Transcript_16301/m.23221 type:complete len:935 (-) Transcript_16301:120-2924(-)
MNSVYPMGKIFNRWHSFCFILIIIFAILVKWIQDKHCNCFIFKYLSNDRHLKIDRFLSWIKSNGGTISPSISIASYENYGGYGLEVTPQSEVHELDVLFSIPSSLIIDASTVLETYNAQITQDIVEILKKNVHSPLVQQDIIISLSIMAECSLGEQSFFKPYLEMLPSNTIPRLDTFNEKELNMLQDLDLKKLAQHSIKQLKQFYSKAKVESLVVSMAKSRSTISKIGPMNHKCTSFESFHKHVSFISSRAMVLHGRKFLTPLADMINYAPRNDDRAASLSNSFTLYHNRDESNGSITGRADRHVQAGKQIFEDYGDVDNSLFLEAHGFVPDENPFHCASITSKFFPTPDELPDALWDSLLALNIFPTNSKKNFPIPSICVKSDGTIEDDRLKAYLKVSALTKMSDQRAKCTESSRSDDYELLTLQCIDYPNSHHALMSLIRSSAANMLCSAQTSLDEDIELLKRLEISMDKGKSKSHREQALIALKFRISDKKILSQLSNVEGQKCSQNDEISIDNFHDRNICDEGQDIIHPNKISTSSLENFKEFLNTLDIRNNMIEPRIVGDDMRLGAFATTDILEGDTYFSIHSDSTISLDTVMNGGYTHQLSSFLSRYKHLRSNGGFYYILLYLMYEKFVSKEKSRFHPYLSILPSIEEMKTSLPLFFSKEKLRFLAGSDMRTRVLIYQKRVSSEYERISSDYELVTIFGADNIRKDYFMWAYAIVDSRSIWWDGKRHLVPLLDLVNCLEFRKSNGVINAPHKTTSDKKKMLAITKATAPFKEGEQLFENYASSNHIYLLYHGFTLINNSYDCAYVSGTKLNVRGHDNIQDMETRLLQHGFDSSTESEFCLKDKKSIDNFANFVRIKYNMRHDVKNGLASDVIETVRNYLRERIDRYKALEGQNSACEINSHAIKAMQAYVQNEKTAFETIYNSLDTFL